MAEKKLQHFYIAEDQSIYLLNHEDATKLKQWVELCRQQLTLLGYVESHIYFEEHVGAEFGLRFTLTVSGLQAPFTM